MDDMRTVLTIADARDREAIYRIRHEIYAAELGQHRPNDEGRLTDALDAVNTYVVAKRQGAVVGFVAVTPPTPTGYSLDKYFARDEVPATFDDGLYEVRLLTITQEARRGLLAFALMFGALRYCESRGAHTIAAIGREDVLDLYRKCGLEPLGRRVRAGAVTYELMTADVAALRRGLAAHTRTMRRVAREIVWRVPHVTAEPVDVCYHGGAFFEAIGDEFDHLDRVADVISADVLDAWFPPAPSVLASVAAQLSFALRTSPPTGSEGLQRVIARSRGVAVDNILPGAGSSDLIFAAFKAWMRPSSRVLILDPMYGEYAHVLERVIGARVERLALSRECAYDVDPERLRAALARGHDWVVLVNPNSPTGRYLPRETLAALLAEAPSSTRIWLDETYIDFAGGESLEDVAASSDNVVVCKSMSKAYALSGVRAAYLCGPAAMMRELRVSCPPWAVSLPAQIAACAALRATDYYRARWDETQVLRHDLSVALADLGWTVVPGCANFVLCHLPADGPDAAAVAMHARRYGLYVRDVSGMSRRLGSHALRVAVKDGPTNARIATLLERVLDEMAGAPARAPHERRPRRAMVHVH